MTATTLGIDYHRQELHKVATDLRNERTLPSPATSGPSRIRIVVGEALVELGTALAAGHRRTSAHAR